MNIQLSVIVINQYITAQISCNVTLIVSNFRGVNGKILHDCDCAYVDIGTFTVVEGDSILP